MVNGYIEHTHTHSHTYIHICWRSYTFTSIHTFILNRWHVSVSICVVIIRALKQHTPLDFGCDWMLNIESSYGKTFLWPVLQLHSYIQLNVPHITLKCSTIFTYSFSFRSTLLISQFSDSMYSDSKATIQQSIHTFSDTKKSTERKTKFIVFFRLSWVFWVCFPNLDIQLR